MEEENGELKSKLAELEKSYRELTEIVDKRGKEFLAKLKERSKTIVRLGGELTKLSAEFANKTRKLPLEGEEKDAKINSLTLLNEALEQDKKAMQNKVDEQQQTISEFKSLTDKNEAVEKDNESLRMQIMRLEGKVSELESRLSTAINKKKNLENDVAELQKQVQTLEGNKEWELAGIDGTLKETSLTIMELLAQQLLLNNQEQSVKEKKLEELTLSYGDQVHQIAAYKQKISR